MGDRGYMTTTSSWQEGQTLAPSCTVAVELCGSPTPPGHLLGAYHHLEWDLWWFEVRSSSGVSGTSSQTPPVSFALALDVPTGADPPTRSPEAEPILAEFGDIFPEDLPGELPPDAPYPARD